MNSIIIGSNKEPILNHRPERYLFIDDGSLIEQLDLPARGSITFFDVSEHQFTPLKGMSYLKAREFISELDSVFPEGENTLTKKGSNFILLHALLSKPKTLGTLLSDSKGPHKRDAYQKIQMLLLSPVLERVLNHPTNPSFTGTIIAKLNRVELGEFDCFVLANLLISQYSGPVMLPDFGFYACPFHVKLIRQNRLIAGVTSLDEVPKLKSHLLQIETKTGSQCTYDDAVTLAKYAGLRPDHDHADNPYEAFIQACIAP